MAFQLGRTLVIKRKQEDPATTFDPICALQERSLAMTNNMIERITASCTDPGGSAPRRTYSPGTQDLRFEGTAIFTADATQKLVMDDVRLQRAREYQIAVPGYGVFEGLFYVETATFSGAVEGDLTVALAWLPADPDYTFTAAT
jgi:predicted secreted protein